MTASPSAFARSVASPNDFALPLLVYVGGPIDCVPPSIEPTLSAAELKVWHYLDDRKALVSDLRALPGVGVYAAWEGTVRQEQSESHRIGQEGALEDCDLLVAFLPNEIATIGTPIEVYRAAMAGKPTVVIGAQGSETIRQLGSHRVDTIDEAIELVRLAVAGELVTVGPQPIPAPTRAPIPPVPAEVTIPPGPLRLPMTVDPVHAWALPVRHYPDDAGLDLYVTETVTIAPGEFADVAAGVRVQLPDQCWGLIVGRSSTIRNLGLLVCPGVVDTGYRGDLFAGAWNLSGHTQTVRVGERIAQLILMPNATKDYAPARVELLADHPRGKAGFGSTGIGCDPHTMVPQRPPNSAPIWPTE